MIRSIAQLLLLPKTCLICQMIFKSLHPICQWCEEKIQLLKYPCIICANTIVFPESLYCHQCLKKASNIHRLYVFYSYEEPLKTLLTLYKFQHGYDLLPYLCYLFTLKLPPEALETECLLPIPMHSKKLRSRGFHQTLLLAKKLGKILKKPVNHSYLQKIKHTADQSKLDARERQFNLKNAFICKRIPFQHVTLIDDITTTGTTIQTMIELLQKQGIRKIDVWCLAKTI